MTYPKPQYREHQDVGALVFSLNDSSYDGKHTEMFAASVKALYEYMRSNTFQFHGSSEGNKGTYKKNSALTSDGIVIHFYGNYSEGFNRIPENMSFELFSFQTPVDNLKKELTEVVRQACKEVRGE